ncbi:DNA polymerase III subunit gamma/tau [Limosilactobacillus sp.]|uniref:DNA polymerase III subunit gamma/tau n=1 Tax=Limosilactobacillus sp. TaxID=2773925 RepID=UPI00345ECEA1
MSYQALYRVWRPQRFDEIVGQQVITRTLKNAIITKQISHAYLFAGPRGTGKTSAAKIFAKAVNCHHAKDGEPCNQCETCKAITAGRLNDVIEIDAASNNGVEEIRDIRDKVKYAPTQADYKVYIIDEVHMLSTGAFNALLKTLEEPPANVIFILATTEPHKIPLTIISRVQRFDFRRISAQDAFDRMKYILDQKHVTYEEKALWVIANAAEGGMRDALSILDQVLSFSDNHVKLDDALLVTGSVAKQLLKKYFLEVTKPDSAAALKSLSGLLASGKDGQRFIEDLISFIRDLLLYQESPSLVHVESTGLSDDDFKQLSAAANATTLYDMIDVLNETQDEMRFTTHPDVYLEVLTVKLCQVGKDQAQPNTANLGAAQETIDQLSQQVSKLQNEVNQLQKQKTTVAPAVSSTTAKSHHAPKRTSSHGGQTRVNLHQVYQVLETATRADLDEVKDCWSDLLTMLSNMERGLVELATPAAAGPESMVVSFQQPFLLQRASGGDLGEVLQKDLQQLCGKNRRVTFVPADKWPQIRMDFLKEHGYAVKGKAKPKPQKSQPRQNPVSAKPAPHPQSGGQAGGAQPAAAGPEPPLPDEPPTPGPASDENPVVSKAEELFGSDVVKIEDN